MSNSRVNKSIRNSSYGLVGTLIYTLFSFVSRSIFIAYLGVEYNGLNSLFTNILSVLSIAELGFASAVAYSLYKPLSENDTTAVAMIMNFLKKVYRIVAIIVLVAGICCIPFLEYLISEPLDELSFSLNELRFYFSLYLINAVCSYLLAHKRTVITADQNRYVISNTDNLAKIILNIVQIVLLIVTRNYIVYLACLIAQTLGSNIILSIYADKKYPYINETKETISKELQKPILKNVSALLFHKVGVTLRTGTISIMISAQIGVTVVGMYGNYTLITAGVTTFVSLIFTSLIASVGNYCVNESNENQAKMFNKIDYMANWIGYFCFICFVILFTPFVTLWIGEENVFSMDIAIIISFNTFILFLRKGVIAFRDAKALFIYDRYKPFLEIGVGVVLAFMLSQVWGVFGIILGYSIATLFVAIPIEIYVLYKHGFSKSCVPLLLKKLVVILFAFAACAVVYFVCSFITMGGILGFAIQLVICLILPNIIFVAATFWTDEFKYFKKLGFGMLSKILKRKQAVASDEDGATKEKYMLEVEEVAKEKAEVANSIIEDNQNDEL